MSSSVAKTLTQDSLLQSDLSDVPLLDDRQVGHIRHIENLSLQLENDWSHMMGRNPLQEDFGGYRFQLSYMSFALALAHFHRLPAAPGLFRKTFDRLIQKMLLPEVWVYWRDISKGGNWHTLDAPRSEGWTDPVVKDNIMYSAYVQTMTLLYNMLFNDDKYAQPGAITFRFEPLFWNFDKPEVFAYDQNSLNDRVYWNMVENGYLGVACEPWCVFLICNQVPIIGFRLHDVLHGGCRAEEVTRGYLQAWQEFGGFLSDNGHFNMLMRSHVKEVVPGHQSPWVDAWCGALMNAWNRDFVRSNYPRQIRDCITTDADGRVSVRFARVPAEAPPAMRRLDGGGSDFGWVAAWVSEMGDETTLSGLLAHAERYMNPVWEKGGYYYPRNDQMFDADGHQTLMSPLEGNALLAYARLNVPDGLWALYNKPWNRSHFDEPALVDISSNVDVLRAAFDAGRNRLVFTLRRRTDRSGEVVVLISNAWRRGSWVLTRDEQTLATGDERTVLTRTADVWREEEHLRFATSDEGASTFILQWQAQGTRS